MKLWKRSSTVVLIVAAVAAATISLGGKAFFSKSAAEAEAPVPVQTRPRDAPAPASEPERLAEQRHGSASEERPAARVDSTESFEADAAGQLVTNEQTRLNVERLVALNSSGEMRRKLEELQRSLPAPAAQSLADLVERYTNYMQVARQTFPPGQAPSSEQDALTQISTLHDLRVQYFGPEAAQAMYGTEEETQRELLELMMLQKDPNLTLQERAERAQVHQQRISERQVR